MNNSKLNSAVCITLLVISLFILGCSEDPVKPETEPIPQSSPGNTLSLDGDNDYAWVPTDAALNPQNNISIEAWVYSENYDRSAWQEIVMKGGNDDSTPRQYFVRPYQGDNRFQFVLHDNDNNINSASSDGTLTNGVWYHIACTYDGQFMRVYVNGILNDEDDEGQFNIQTSSGILAFGRLGNVSAEYFDGKIDEVRIWNIARTQSQIISTLNSTLSPAYYSSADSGLIGYWRFDKLEDLGVNGDGSDDVRDFSIYGNHADLENGAELVLSQAWPQ